MPNDIYAMVCPYYHKTIGNAIFCEGICADGELNVSESFIKQVFANSKERNACYVKYCAGFRYPECIIARINEAVKGSKD